MNNKEINTLINYIKENYQDYEVEDRSRISLMDNKNHEGLGVRIKSLDFSAIWLKGSYGYEEGLIEIMCPIHFTYDSSVQGYFTANECIAILKNYEKLKALSQERDTIIEQSKEAIDEYYEKHIRKIIEKNTTQNP